MTEDKPLLKISSNDKIISDTDENSDVNNIKTW